MNQKKIGQSVLRRSGVLTEPWMKNKLTSREKVLRVLEEAEGKLSVSEIARRAGLSWPTTRNALNELMLLGKTVGERIGKGKALLFKVKDEKKRISRSF